MSKIRIITIICLILTNNISYSQVKFETNLKYKIAWGNKLVDEYHQDIEENNSSNNSSELIKNDNKYIESSKNVIIDFILKNIKNENLICLADIEGDTLSKKQIFEKIYWKWHILSLIHI